MSITNLNEVQEWFNGSDIRGWSRNFTMTSASVVHNGAGVWQASFDYTGLCNIPAYYKSGDSNNVHNVNGSIWIIRDYNGQRIAGTIDYLRKCQKGKEFHTSPEYKLMPKKGDLVGIMVSTMNRSYDGTYVEGDSNSPYRQRSDVIEIIWPEDSVASSLTGGFAANAIFGYDACFGGPPPEEYLPLRGNPPSRLHSVLTYGSDTKEVWQGFSENMKELKDDIIIPKPILPTTPTIDYNDFMTDKKKVVELEMKKYLPDVSDEIDLNGLVT